MFDPLKLFEEVVIVEGCSPEFPLDFLAPGEKSTRSVVLTNYLRPGMAYEGENYVTIPLFDLLGSGEDTYEVENVINYKKRQCCEAALLVAGLNNNEYKPGRVEIVLNSSQYNFDKQLLSCCGIRRNAEFCLKINPRRYNFIIAVRTPIQKYEGFHWDPDPYYGFSSLGIGVLDIKDVKVDILSC